MLAGNQTECIVVIMTKNKTTSEGTKFLSYRHNEITTSEEWRKAFPKRYAGLPAKAAKAFAARDFKNAK